MQHTKLKGHITHASGERKTVCVTACLTALGIPVENFHYTGSVADQRREAILRRHGYAVRSRMSSIPKNASVGKARAAIQKMNDPTHTLYLVTVMYGKSRHAMLLNRDGNTIVDTDPRKVDKRKITSIKAVWKAEK